MGHYLEYVIDLPAAQAREWLAPLGWFAPDYELRCGELPYGEFAWGGKSLHATFGPAACFVSVPEIKYSLLLDPSPSVEWVARFEKWLGETLPGVRAVRLDELLRINWEQEIGRDWDKVPDPVSALWAWLPTQDECYGDDYYRLLSG